jgi:hypothetical protein
LSTGNSAGTSKVLVENQLNIVKIATMTPVKFRNLLGQKADYILLSHKTLRRPSAKYADPVKAHAAHRASPQGGGYDTLVVNIDELYDQFTFGEKTPLAVYDF